MQEPFYNPDKAEEEKAVKQDLQIRQEKRNAYFGRLKKDKAFQHYVVDEIIKSNIIALTDGRLLDVTKSKDKEAFADLVVLNIKASKVLENIFNQIMS